MRNVFKCPKNVWQSFSEKEKEAYNIFYDYIYEATRIQNEDARRCGLLGAQRSSREAVYKLRLMAHSMAKVAANLTTDILKVYDKS